MYLDSSFFIKLFRSVRSVIWNSPTGCVFHVILVTTEQIPCPRRFLFGVNCWFVSFATFHVHERTSCLGTQPTLFL